MRRGITKGTLNAPGMPCPECETRMVIDPRVLLSAVPLACPGCGLEFEVNTEESAGALNALQEYMNRFEEMERRISAALDVDEAPEASRHRRDRPRRRRRRRKRSE